MVVYSTEARGYSVVMLSALVAFLALERYLDEPSRPLAMIFWVCIVVGFLAHLSMLQFYVGAVLWSHYRLRARARDWLRLHLVPLACATLWYLTVIRGLQLGGGPRFPWLQVADQALGWTVGYPTSTVPPFIAVALAAAIVVWDARRLHAEGSDQWLLYVPVILGPPLFSAVLSPGFFYPRYFLVSLVFLLLALARSLSALWLRPALGKPLAAGLVVLMLAGNLLHTVRFWRIGRGGASRAISYLVANSRQPEIRVSSEPIDLWATLPIRFYERKLNLGSRIHYVPHARLRGANTHDEQLDWLIIQTLDAWSGQAATLRLASGEAFTLQSEYPNYGPTGMNWFLYRRAAGQAPGNPPPPRTRNDDAGSGARR